MFEHRSRNSYKQLSKRFSKQNVSEKASQASFTCESEKAFEIADRWNHYAMKISDEVAWNFTNRNDGSGGGPGCVAAQS